ncbi:integrase [Roseovarius sp. HI0049]|nr:integrase [Roseovarius sp. HI0049]
MSLKLYKRGEFWHFRGSVAGRRLRGSTGTASKVLAQRIAAETEAREWRRHLDGPTANVTFAQAAIAYREAEKPDRFLARVEDFWKDALIREITPGAIRKSAQKLYPDASGATRNRQVIVPTCAIINHAADLGWCRPIKVKRFPVDTKERTPATLEWVEAFAAQAEADGLPHLAALALFMFGTGARVGEATALAWKAVAFDQGTVRINMGKTRTERVAHLPSPVIATLANIPGPRRPRDLVFGYAGRGSVSQVWNNVAARAGIEPLTPHCCRHGFATTLLQKGYDVATVAARGGWKDAATVLRTYAHALQDNRVTDALFGTDLTQGEGPEPVTISNKRRK